MAEVTAALLKQWHYEITHSQDKFVSEIPKVELHIHIEGTLTPELRWKLAMRNKLTIHSSDTGQRYENLDAMKSRYYPILASEYVHGGPSTFFRDYFAGLQVLLEEEDFYKLAMEYYRRAYEMNIRYCEVFFDPQAHTSRGVGFEKFMPALKRARDDAASAYNVQANYIACVLRDRDVDNGVEHYKQLLPYREMVVGIGLDSVETGRPPLLFEPLFSMARKDGFKITCHYDIGQKDTISNIGEVVEKIGGGSGADRCDHGISAARDPTLVRKLAAHGTGMTLCPWGYVRFAAATESDIPGKIRLLFDSGIKITINSDDPGYMDDIWLEQSIHLVRKHCDFTDDEIVQLQLNAVDICWASDAIKLDLRRQIEEFGARSGRK